MPLAELVLWIPTAVLLWAYSGPGVFHRGRGQVMWWTVVFLGAYWGGIVGAVVAFGILGTVTALVLRRHRLPLSVEPVVDFQPLTNFRKGDDADAIAATVGASFLVAVTFPYWKARISLRVYELQPGRILRFERIVLSGHAKDSLAVESFLPSGAVVESIDRVTQAWDRGPGEIAHMRFCDTLPGLVAFHEENLASHGEQPLVIDGDQYLERMQNTLAARMQYCTEAGLYRHVGDAYAYQSRAILFAIRHAFDVITAYRHEQTVIGGGGLVRQRTRVADPSPESLVWERPNVKRATTADAALTILLMTAGAILLGQVLSSLVAP